MKFLSDLFYLIWAVFVFVVIGSIFGAILASSGILLLILIFGGFLLLIL